MPFKQARENLWAQLATAHGERGLSPYHAGSKAHFRGRCCVVRSLHCCAGHAVTSILDIDELNLQATVEPGVITEVFQNAVKEKGLFYPPDPASGGSCFLGGNLANNSGGPKAVKYGVTRDYVINLEVVLPTGEIIWTGANVLKNSTGYNLTQLMCGSEGTLGVITKVVFKLRGYPQKNILLLIPFSTNEEACKAIAAIFIEGITPSGMEFFEREAGVKTIAYCKEVLNSPVTTLLPEEMDAYLLCELDGNDKL